MSMHYVHTYKTVRTYWIGIPFAKVTPRGSVTDFDVLRACGSLQSVY